MPHTQRTVDTTSGVPASRHWPFVPISPTVPRFHGVSVSGLSGYPSSVGLRPRTDSWILIVEDEPAAARCVARLLCGAVRAVAVGTCRQALEILSPATIGAIVDLGLPDRGGAEFLRNALTLRPGLPAVALSCSDDPASVREVLSLGAGFFRKPATGQELQLFVQRALAVSRARRARLTAAIDRWAAQYRLSPREVDILTAAMDGAEHSRLAAVGGVSSATIKTQVHRLVRKVGARSLQSLVSEVLRTALELDL